MKDTLYIVIKVSTNLSTDGFYYILAKIHMESFVKKRKDRLKPEKYFYDKKSALQVRNHGKAQELAVKDKNIYQLPILIVYQH